MFLGREELVQEAACAESWWKDELSVAAYKLFKAHVLEVPETKACSLAVRYENFSTVLSDSENTGSCQDELEDMFAFLFNNTLLKLPTALESSFSVNTSPEKPNKSWR